LKEVGIKDAETRFDNYPHQFSGGMRQRVVISLALCCEPELLIADEPTTALDVSIQSQILELIKKLTKERNLAVILITHDMGVIAETADRVAVMKSGNLVEIGETKKILTKPQENYTKSLVSSVPPTNKKISRFVIVEKENSDKKENNIKILNRWTKKEIIDQGLVQIKSLSKNFDDNFFTESSKNSVMAVNGVSFDIKEGESFGLVGESGSGKSTIAKMNVKTEITPGNLGSEFHLNLFPPRRAGILKRVNGKRIFASPIFVIMNKARIPLTKTNSGKRNLNPSTLTTSYAI